MNILPMRYYMTVAEKRSLSKAAAELHITQQTLSAHMAALERELGCRLFQRRPVFKLSYAGEVFLRYCRQWDSLERSMKDEFADMEDGRSAEIKLGIAHTRGKILLPRAITGFRAAHPGVRFRLCEETNDALLAMLLDERIDMMVGCIPPETPELEVESLFAERVCVVSPRPEGAEGEAPGGVQALREYPLLMCDESDILGRIGGAVLDEANIVPDAAVRSRNIETLLKLCAAGVGACLCTDYLAAGVLSAEERARVSISELDRQYTISAAWKKRPYTGRVYLQLAECLRAAAER